MAKDSKEKDENEFSFDDFVLGQDNFDNSQEEEKKEEVVEKEEEEEEENDNEAEEESEEESEEEDEVEEEEAEIVNEKDKEEEESIEDESEGFVNIIELMHEQNGWEFNPDDFKEKDSVDGLMSFIAEIVEANSKPEFASDEVAKFNEFVSKYGEDKASEYLNVNYGNVDYESADLTDVDNMKQLWADYLKNTTKFSEEKIKRQIEKAEELGELDEEIDEMKNFMIDLKKKKIDEVEQKAQLEKENQIKAEKDYLAYQKERIFKADKIADFDMTKKDKEDLFKFAYEIGRDGKTGYQKMKEQNPDLDLELLTIAFKSLNKGKISKIAESEAAKNLKKKLSRFESLGSKSKSKAGTPKRVKDDSNDKPDYNSFLLSK